MPNFTYEIDRRSYDTKIEYRAPGFFGVIVTLNIRKKYGVYTSEIDFSNGQRDTDFTHKCLIEGLGAALEHAVNLGDENKHFFDKEVRRIKNSLK